FEHTPTPEICTLSLHDALPIYLHAEWSKRAADAGKHVLCEKPAARTADEARDAIDHCVERGVMWMEAFMYRFHPQWQLLFERLRSEEHTSELQSRGQLVCRLRL